MPDHVSDAPAARRESDRVEETPADLGTLVSTHRATRPHWTLFLVTTIGVIALSAAFGKQPMMLYLALGVLLVGVPLAIVSMLARRLHASVELREDGIVITRAWTDPVIVRFDDVDEVYYDIGGLSFSGFQMWGPTKTTLVTFGGRRIVLVRGLSGANELLAMIDRRITRALYVPAKQAMKDREPLIFGPLELHDDSVVANGVPLSWSALGWVEVWPERIDFFSTEASFRFASIPIPAIPHPLLLMTLLDGKTTLDHKTSAWVE
jgi:hypothetical protein